MKEEETSYPTNFLISISPDGRIESISSFGGEPKEEMRLEESRTYSKRLCNRAV